MASVDFTGQGIPEIPAFSTTPVTVSREVTPSAAPAPATAPAPGGGNVLARAETDRAPATPAVTTPHSSSIADNEAAPAPPDPEELYEEVMTRLRRDLIAELEQNGHLLRNTF
jgi:hypothetical protein